MEFWHEAVDSGEKIYILIVKLLQLPCMFMFK